MYALINISIGSQYYIEIFAVEQMYGYLSAFKYFISFIHKYDFLFLPPFFIANKFNLRKYNFLKDVSVSLRNN